MVFHSLQDWQRPIHFGEVAPQLEQTNIFLTFDNSLMFVSQFIWGLVYRFYPFMYGILSFNTFLTFPVDIESTFVLEGTVIAL